MLMGLFLKICPKMGKNNYEGKKENCYELHKQYSYTHEALEPKKIVHDPGSATKYMWTPDHIK